jgi:two-component system response regulator VicR
MKKIMVIDDEPDLIFTVKDALKDEYEVITADSGRKCLDLLKKNETPDLIILDIMMPEMSGWETFNKIKENQLWDNIPVIFLTARTDYMAKDTGRFLGNDFIEKPFDIKDLKKRIEKVFGS